MSLTFLSQLLDEYGRPRDRYEGVGDLANETKTACIEWAAAQYDDGEVLLACRGNASPPDLFYSGPSRFSGQSSDCIAFYSEKLMGELPILRHVPRGQSGWWAVYCLGMLQADFFLQGQPALIRYLLTNFEFDVRCAGEPMSLVLSGVEGPVRLVPTQDYASARNRLRALRSPRPTAWLEMPAQGGASGSARRIADDICGLLSIARGTKVAWIQEEEVSTEGIRTHLIHANRITKPFAPHAPIDPRLIGGTSDFLEACYPTFVEKRDHYKLDRGTIDSVLDAKVETDFLETRGAKLAIALETLKHNVLVAESMQEVLIRNGVSGEAAKAITASLRLRSLNRRSFSNLLRRICKQIDLELESAELDLFIRCRNSLVHLSLIHI